METQHKGGYIEQELLAYTIIPPEISTIAKINFDTRVVGTTGEFIRGQEVHTRTEHERTVMPRPESVHIEAEARPLAPLQQPTTEERVRAERRERVRQRREQKRRDREGVLKTNPTTNDDQTCRLVPVSEQELEDVRTRGGLAALPANRIKLEAPLPRKGEHYIAKVVRSNRTEWVPDDEHPNTVKPVLIRAGSIEVIHKGKIRHEEPIGQGKIKVTIEKIDEKGTFPPEMVKELLGETHPTARDNAALAMRENAGRRIWKGCLTKALPLVVAVGALLATVRGCLPTTHPIMPQGQIRPMPTPNTQPQHPFSDSEQMSGSRFAITETHAVRNEEELWDDVAAQLNRINPNFARMEQDDPQAFNDIVKAWVLADEQLNAQNVSNYRDLQPTADHLTEYTDAAMR